MEKKLMVEEIFSCSTNLIKKSNIKLQSKHLKKAMDADSQEISQ
jgi:hypothetical protein